MWDFYSSSLCLLRKDLSGPLELGTRLGLELWQGSPSWLPISLSISQGTLRHVFLHFCSLLGMNCL